MPKIVPLSEIGSLANSASARAVLNANWERIQDALANTLSRDGSGPNEMLADLDLNSNHLLNVADPVTDSDGVNLRTLREMVESLQMASTGDWTSGVEFTMAVSAGQTSVPLDLLPRPFNANVVFYNGIFQQRDAYTMTPNAIVFNEPLPVPGTVTVVATFKQAEASAGAIANAATIDIVNLRTLYKGRSFPERAGELRSLKDEGAMGNSVADDTAALQAVLSLGGEVYLPAGRYRTSELVVPSNTTINMHADAILDFSGEVAGTVLGQKRLFSLAGTSDAGVALVANVAVGDTQIQVAGTATFARGDLITVRSNDQFMPGASGTASFRGFMTRVRSVDSSTLLTLEERAPFAVAVASTGRVIRHTPVENVTIRGGKLVGGGVGKVHNGIYASFVRNLTVEDVEMVGFEDCGVRAEGVMNLKVRGCTIADSTSAGGALQTGYGVGVFTGSRNTLVTGNTFRNCRHAHAAGGTIPTLHGTFSENDVQDCGLGTAAVDIHEPCFWYSLSRNRITGGAGGIVCRGQNTLIEGNIIEGSAGPGIRVQQFVTNTDGISNIEIIGNSVSNTSGNGIEIRGTDATQRVSSVLVAKNSVNNVSFNGVWGNFVDNLAVDGNIVRNIVQPGTTDGNGIRVSGTAAGDNRRVTITNNQVRGTTRHGIFVTRTDGLTITGNDVSAVAGSPQSHGVFVENSDGVNVGQCNIDVSLTGNSAGIGISATNRVTISGCVIKGLSTNTAQDGIRVYNGSGTNNTLVVSGCVVTGVGRNGIYTTATDRVIVTNNDMRDAVNVTKINITGATTSFSANNVV